MSEPKNEVEEFLSQQIAFVQNQQQALARKQEEIQREQRYLQGKLEVLLDVRSYYSSPDRSHRPQPKVLVRD